MENVKSEEKNEQDSSKRPIEEVDDDDKNVNEMNKKMKTCDTIKNYNIEKTDQIMLEKKDDDDEKKVIFCVNFM